MALTPTEAQQLVADDLLPKFRNERQKLNRIDRWARWEHEQPHRPRHATAEYRELSARAQAPWGDLVVTSVAQTLYVEGYRRPDAPEDSTGWRIWQANGMDGRQVAIHRAALTYGLAYGVALPGTTMAGEKMPTMRGVSPREMIAVYDDVAADDWPIWALQVRKVGNEYRLRLYDDELINNLTIGKGGLSSGTPVYESTEAHNAGACPVVRYTNRFDLEGRAAGEIEPFISVLGKIDQTSFDRIVVQRFASWIVRTISGMSAPEPTEAQIEALTNQGVSEEQAKARIVEQQKLRLKVEDLLVAEDHDTKFGSLPATPLNGFISAHESDLGVLAAVSQTPAFELLGQIANLSAEALAASKASQTAKSDERKHTLGEQHEQLIRLALHIAGDSEGADDFLAQVRWADTSIRSLAQAADAFGKLVQMLEVPPQVLWPKIPGFTQQDVDEAKQLHAERGGMFDQLLRDLEQGSPTGAGESAQGAPVGGGR